MKYLLHSIPLKIAATILASASLLIAIFSLTASIVYYDRIFTTDENWYESKGMSRHNEQVVNLIWMNMEYAMALEEKGTAVRELPAKDLEHAYDLFMYPRDYGDHASYVNNNLEGFYRAGLSDISIYTKLYAVSDGKRVLYHSPELKLSEIGEDASPEGLMKSFKSLASVEPVLLDSLSAVYTVDDQTYQGDRAYLYSEVASSDFRYFIYLPAVSAANVDGFLGYEKLFYQMAPYRTLLPWIAFFSSAIFILLLTYLWSAAGYRRRADGTYTLRGEITLSWFDRIPFELMAGAMSTGVGLLLLLAVEAGEMAQIRFPEALFDFRMDPGYISRLIGPLWPAVLACLLAVIAAAVFLLSLIRRLKARSFWRYSLIGYMIFGIKKSWQRLYRRINGKPALLLLLIPYLVLVLIFLAFFSYGRYDGFASFISFLIGLALFVALPLLLLSHLIYLKQSSAKLTEFSLALAEGEEPQEIPTNKLHPDFRPLEENLRKLDEGLQQAVSKQLQADRLKTDLITNVSHDLKTPLTSIINYIDLLKREGLDSDNAPSYLETLDQKANRLKQLTEDLVEASKASSGNLSVEREWLDLIELMRQACGEFEEKMLEKKLNLVMRLPENTPRLMIWNDGGHIWRIVENLMDNARKYALPGSRVYLTLRLLSEAWILEVKNISAMQIDLSTSDLMERFVRGDSARSSEGSGLGLSITSSLAGLLGGRMDLDVKDDVFTATITLPVVNAPYPADSGEAAVIEEDRKTSEE